MAGRPAVEENQLSTETLIQNGFNQASQLAFQSSGAARRLVDAAVATLYNYEPNWPKDAIMFNEVGVQMDSDGFDTTKKPMLFPEIRPTDFPDTPALADIDSVRLEFKATLPDLTLPTFDYRNVSEIPAFSEAAPAIDARVNVPSAPGYDAPDKPSLIAINPDVPNLAISVPPLSITTPDYQNGFEDEFYRAFSQGQARVPAAAEAQIWMDRQFPGLDRLFAALVARIEGAMNGTETAMGDTFDAHQYGQLLQRVEADRERQLRTLDDAARAGGWGLPGAVRIAGTRDIAVTAAQARNAAAIETYNKRAEIELKHLQFVMDLAARLRQISTDFFFKMADHGLAAFKASLAFAETAVRFAHAVYELRQKDFEIRARLVGLQIEVFEGLLKGQMAQIEVIKTTLEVEKLKSDLNDQLIKQYTAELGAEEIKARVYASRISALELELKARKFPLELFLGKVQAYEALTNAKKAEYGLLQAEIDGDKAKLDGELAKLKVYETQARVFETEVSARGKQAEIQSRRNDQILEQFKTLVHAELQQVQADTARSEHSLNAYKTTAEVFLAENSAALQKSKFEYDQQIENAKLALEQLRFKFEKQFRLLDVERTRVKALSEIQMSAAHVDGRMAEAAMSAMNAVVSASVEG